MAYQRKFTLEADGPERAGGELTVEDIEAFLEEWEGHSPRLLSATFEVEDEVCDPS
ncbi:hypothetical protein [Halomarina litorea]|uniref:hypothetical protein n=1 Tax=Halomarina litorea TaxID=2961595 RepID=UPI0020C20963|nr:hypothetical protein [Halomarina sp. BCD28]